MTCGEYAAKLAIRRMHYIPNTDVKMEHFVAVLHAQVEIKSAPRQQNIANESFPPEVDKFSRTM